jgi:hypothetical protein
VSDDALNPYAPPVAAEPLALPEAARLWMVHGDHLLVRDGARIPPVPLHGEDDGSGLTTSHQVFATASGTSMLALLVPFAFSLLVMVLISVVFDRSAVLEGVLTFFIVSRLLRRFTKIGPSLVNIHCHLPITALKARARRDRWRGWMTMAAFTAFLLLLLGDKLKFRYTWGDDEREYLWAVRFVAPTGLLMVACFLGSLVWLAMERGLKCVNQTGGWFYLSGVPASSLVKLAAMSGEAPPVRARKVYTLYQYRLPMGILLGPRRNPILVLIVAIMKVLRSPAFVRRNFHWSEARRGVMPDEALAAQIAKLRSQPEFSSWLELGCNRLDSPQGELRVLTARLASPDRRHFCHITLARISKARAYVEVCQTDFRTWTTDGRCLITSGQPPFPKLPGYLEFQRVRGSTARRWAGHLRRCERVTPRVLIDEELRGLLEKEADDHAALLQAAGINGPVEEVEMPGDWDELVEHSLESRSRA